MSTPREAPATDQTQHGPKPEAELSEFISLLTTIDPKQNKRAIRLLVENVDARVWDVALLYVRTCAETRG